MTANRFGSWHLRNPSIWQTDHLASYDFIPKFWATLYTVLAPSASCLEGENRMRFQSGRGETKTLETTTSGNVRQSPEIDKLRS